jgi:hypothetical protein
VCLAEYDEWVLSVGDSFFSSGWEVTYIDPCRGPQTQWINGFTLNNDNDRTTRVRVVPGTTPECTRHCKHAHMDGPYPFRIETSCKNEVIQPAFPERCIGKF